VGVFHSPSESLGFSTGLYVRALCDDTGLYVRHLIYPVKNHVVNESSSRIPKILDFVDKVLEKRTARSAEK